MKFLNQIKLIFSLLTSGLLYISSNLLPKKKSLWVYGAWFGEKYCDNPKILFEYVNKHHPEVRSIWISRNNQTINEIALNGFEVFHMHSLRGIWYQLIAEFAFVCQAHDVDLFSPCLGKKTTIINLWHGMPLKKIIYDEFGHIVIHKNLKGRIVDALSPYKRMRNDYLIALNERTQHTLAGAFRLPLDKVLITGFPRNDIFIAPTKSSKSTNSLFRVIYMPTMRKSTNGSDDLFLAYAFDLDKISKILLDHNIELVLRMHPINKPPRDLKDKIEITENISFDTSDDILETLGDYDCLITDYSSIYIDFLLSGKPILFAPFDLDTYKNNERELYYDYEDVTLTPYSFNWHEVINNLIIVKENTFDAEYATNYQHLVDKFHQPHSGQKFSEILVNKINKLRL